MKWTGLNELRESFLSFYESKAHTRLDSASLVPKDEASLLLINSGMAPLKKYFLGLETPPNTKVTTCQKCIRTPDIENVGKTARHGTFFEMLGNFSFGDYFKEEATTWAWEFITQKLELPIDRLYVSVYEDDDEAFEIWTKRRGVAEDHMVRLGKEDNFWEIGAGPCGPCSEIYFDRGPEKGCGKPGCAVGCDCDRFVEFWNLVFTQFNSDGAGNYTPLAHPNIDTGMGLERLACIMQGVDNLFEVDTVRNIMNHICDIAGVEYKKDAKTDVSIRVVTDHIRSTTFMIGDGVVPQNEGRGYVLRRLLRRAARHGRLLGIKEPFLYKVCETVIKENISAYPELEQNKDYIIKVIRLEEERFAKTIDQGMSLLGEITDRLKAQGDQSKIFPGAEAFRLYDTFGFPLDLTREIVEEMGFTVDEDGYKEMMQKQRETARAATAALGDFAWAGDALKGQDITSEFVGYTQMRTQTKAVAIVYGNELTETLGEGDAAQIVLAQTPFYAESGGQVGDTGFITSPGGIFEVTDCKKSPSGYFIHIGFMKKGVLSLGDTVDAHVDEKRRMSIMRNHTSAHLLQKALREVLGDHVHQAGSMVDDKICRFDFSHFSAMTADEIKRTEAIVNELIMEANPVSCSEMPLEEAKKLGAMALFGEKYGNVVRVVNANEKSIEFCGGTHVDNTARIGLFKIIKESSVAAGVRRIEAVTGEGILRYIAQTDALVGESCAAVKVGSAAELPEKISQLSQELKSCERKIAELEQNMAAQKMKALLSSGKDVAGIKLVAADMGDTKADTLRSMCDIAKAGDPLTVAVLVAFSGGKGTVAAGCGPEAVAKGANAGKIVKAVCSACGGNGGGRPDSAMGGFTDSAASAKALETLEELLAGMIK